MQQTKRKGGPGRMKKQTDDDNIVEVGIANSTDSPFYDSYNYQPTQSQSK